MREEENVVLLFTRIQEKPKAAWASRLFLSFFVTVVMFVVFFVLTYHCCVIFVKAESSMGLKVIPSFVIAIVVVVVVVIVVVITTVMACLRFITFLLSSLSSLSCFRKARR